MPTMLDGTWACEFGHQRLSPDLVSICKALRPLPRAVAELARAGGAADLAQVSIELLLEAAIASRADCIYAFCRLNASATRELTSQQIRRQAFPIDVDAASAEVLAEVADAARFVAPSRVADLYRSIPGISARVIDDCVEEVLGFVPTAETPIVSSKLAESLATRVDVPSALLANLKTVVDAATTRVLAAQALLQLSSNDRMLLLEPKPRARNVESAAPSVAGLLSATAARRRFDEEFDRIARWLRRALSPAAKEKEGDDSA